MQSRLQCALALATRHRYHRTKKLLRTVPHFGPRGTGVDTAASHYKGGKSGAMLAKVNQPASAWEACMAYLVAELGAPTYETDWGSLLLPMLSKGPNEASTPRNATHPVSMMIQDTHRRKAVRFACGLVLDGLAWPFLGNQLTGIWSRLCC